jgi:hypothetical protein
MWRRVARLHSPSLPRRPFRCSGLLPATIGGTLGSPPVSIDAAAAVQRGLKNELQRRLGDLLDQFKRAQ